MHTPSSDQGIPLLTEVIDPQATPQADAKPAPRPAMPAPPIELALPTPSELDNVPTSLLVPAVTPSSISMATPPIAPTLATSPQVTPSLAMPVSTPTSASETSQANNTWQNSEFGELEKDLRERITRQVLGRIDFVLDHRVRSTLTDVVDSAIDTLAVEIKRGLHETLSEIVARAVAQEISRLQSTKK